jgi:hypothetical protein
MKTRTAPEETLVKLLALDPSSTRTGYAVFEMFHDAPSGAALIDAGYLQPPKREAPAIERIAEMVVDLRELMHELMPRNIVIEIPSGHVGNRHLGRGAGLSIYGLAVGALWSAARAPIGGQGRRIEVLTLEENAWTRGVQKNKRQMAVAMEFPQYREVISKDGGADVADAIGLGRFAIERMKIEAGAVRT